MINALIIKEKSSNKQRNFTAQRTGQRRIKEAQSQQKKEIINTRVWINIGENKKVQVTIPDELHTRKTSTKY